MDDILIIYNNNTNITNQILTEFNQIHPKLQFTVEEEFNNVINYLDISIQKHKHFLEFKIFRKPTTSKLAIDKSSIHPISQKESNLNFLLNRLNNIPLNKRNYNNELNKIIEIGIYNNFSKDEVLKLNRNIINKINKRKMTTLNRIQDDTNKYYKMTYFGSISEKIKQTFQKHNIHIAFSINNRTQKSFKNPSRETPIDLESGVYRLNCECGSKYIGKTIRTFKKRISEHKYCYNYNLPEKSNFANHLLQPNHIAVPFNNTYDIVKVIHGKYITDLWESLEIYKHGLKYELINDQQPNNSNPLFEITKTFRYIYDRHEQKITTQKIPLSSRRK